MGIADKSDNNKLIKRSKNIVIRDPQFQEKVAQALQYGRMLQEKLLDLAEDEDLPNTDQPMKEKLKYLRNLLQQTQLIPKNSLAIIGLRLLGRDVLGNPCVVCSTTDKDVAMYMHRRISKVPEREKMVVGKHLNFMQYFKDDNGFYHATYPCKITKVYEGIVQVFKSNVESSGNEKGEDSFSEGGKWVDYVGTGETEKKQKANIKSIRKKLEAGTYTSADKEFRIHWTYDIKWIEPGSVPKEAREHTTRKELEDFRVNGFCECKAKILCNTCYNARDWYNELCGPTEI